KVRRLQLVGVSEDKGVYSFSCQDIQRAAKKTVFEPHTGSLTTALDALATSTTVVLGNIDAGAFPYIAGFSHIKIDDEIMEVVATVDRTLSLQISLTVTRGAMSTVKAAHAQNADVSEVVKLAGDPLEIALKVLTGVAAVPPVGWQLGTYDTYRGRFDSAIYPMVSGLAVLDIGSPPAVDIYGVTAVLYKTLSIWRYNQVITIVALPTHWHCGMSMDFHIDLQEWDGVRDTATTNNTPLANFEFLMDQGTDGKLFVEREIMQPLGLFMRVKGDGRLGVRKYSDLANQELGQGTGIGANSNGDYKNSVLDQDVVMSFGKLEVLRKGDLMTTAILEYDKRPRLGGKFTRRALFTDQVGYAKHGKGRSFKMKSHGIVATDSEGLNAMFTRLNRVLARFSRPPMRIQVKCLPKMAALEIGDTVRLKIPERDPFTGQGINRNFEILKSSLSPKDGVVSFDLIGQAEVASVTNFRKVSGYTDAAFLNSSTGTLLTAADGALPQDLVDGDYYCIGDLNISANWIINGTVRIFCSGALVVSGSIDGKGRSNSYNGYASAGGQGGNGYFSVSYQVGHLWGYDDATYNKADTTSMSSGGAIDGVPIDVVGSAFDASNIATSLTGLPVSLSGALGGNGAQGINGTRTGELKKAIKYAAGQGYAGVDSSSVWALAPLYGGTAAQGGAGLTLCARRVEIQAGSSIDLSGADSVQPAAIVSGNQVIEVIGFNDQANYTFQAGKGGAGGGGSLLCIAESGVGALNGIFVNQKPDLSGGDAAQGNNAKAGGGKMMQELL
ncbi:MAG: hypothetical protein R8M45_08020, partial [Ghiorsea sp.]